MTNAPRPKRSGRPREHATDAARRRAYLIRLADQGFRRVQVKVPATPEHLAKIKNYATELREEYSEQRAETEAAEFARTRRKRKDEHKS